VTDSFNLVRSITNGVFKKLPYITSLPPAKGTDTFYAKVNGNYYHAESISAGIVTGRFIVKGGDANDSKSIILQFNRYFYVGLDSTLTYFITLPFPAAYPFNLDQYYYSAGYTENFNENYGQAIGRIIMTNYDPVAKRLSGKFDFDASSLTGNKTVAISEGYFSVGY